MILVTGADTNLPAYIWVSEIDSMQWHKGGEDKPSYTTVSLHNPKQKHAYKLDVLESPTEINRRIKEERLACASPNTNSW